jgi:Transposase DDE domain group 1
MLVNWTDQRVRAIARGGMENSIKKCQLDLFADRTSGAATRANQLRLWFASMAYVLLCASRGLAHTQFADATCGTIRVKLFGTYTGLMANRIYIVLRELAQAIVDAETRGDTSAADARRCDFNTVLGILMARNEREFAEEKRRKS